MALTPWLDFTDFGDIQRDMERLMGYAPTTPITVGGRTGRSIMAFKPKVDVLEDEKRICVHAELPGLSKEDIKLDFTNGNLEISGNKESKSEEKGATWHRTERTWGQFFRRIPLPEGVDTSKVRANFKNGVLDIEVEKPVEEGQKHSINIE